jgi:RNA polymerase sigma factor (sigma-70 family)
MVAGVHQAEGSRVDIRAQSGSGLAGDVPWDGSAGTSKGQTITEDAPWWELDGYPRHAACLIAARNGDRKALDALVLDLNPLVWKVARSQLVDRTVAEDVVQTVWLTLLRNLHTVAEPRALAQWLITTTRREASRHRNGMERVEPLADDAAERLHSAEGLPEEEALRSDRDRSIWRAFNQLSQRCQSLLRMTVIAGRAEYDRVAEALDMKRGSIGPTRGRCIDTLRDFLTTEGGKS